MGFINFCKCGKAIDESYIYCPWCGTQRKQTDDKAILENVLKQLEVKQSEDMMSRVRRIELQLEKLEQELARYEKLNCKDGLEADE